MQTIHLQSVNSVSKKYLQKKGSKSLLKSDFMSAFSFFESAFWLDTNDLESRIGLYLADIGNDFGYEAVEIYEFYQSLLAFEPRSRKYEVQKLVLHLIRAFDDKTHNMSQMVQNSQNTFLESCNAINFADIKTMLKTQDFKDFYTRLPLNTQFVFNQKKDFYDFLALLIKHDYIDTLLNYIDALPKYDLELIPLIEAANHKLEAKNKRKK